MLAEQASPGCGHHLDVNRPRQVPSKAVRQGASRRIIENGINVDSLASRKAGRETLVDLGCVAHAAVARQQRIERDRKSLDREGARRRKRHDLAGRMHAAVRPAGAGNLYRFAQQTFECVLQDAGDGAHGRLPLKAAILRAVVLDG